jgi:hypothetical protein
MQLNMLLPYICALQVSTYTILVLSCIRVELYLWVVQTTDLSLPLLPKGARL